MDASQLDQSMDHSRSVCPLQRANKSQVGHNAATNASQELVMSTTDDQFHWCAEMDYQFGQWSTHSPKDIFENSTSEISFTSNSDSSVSTGRYKNFDIHLAQIDIETFKSEDIERISHTPYTRPMEDSTDTLRIVESLRSLNVANEASKHLQPPSDDLEAISVDSLDLSIDNEINAQLIQKCSERDKTRYKIAMIDTSVHSQMQNSVLSTNSDIDYSSHSVNNNHHPLNRVPNNSSNLQLNLNRRTNIDSRCSNPFITSLQQQQQCDNSSSSSRNSSVDTLQSPGSLVQMFIQNKICLNESSVLEPYVYNGNYLNESLTKCDIHNYNNNVYARQHSQGSEPMANYAIEEMEEHSADNSLNTVDSNELPLHVLDLSKKLRSMNLGKQIPRFGSTSASSNTSYTSTTTSSSAATFDRRRTSGHTSSTNPFLQMTDDKRTRTTSTQFPEMFQDKEVQASFEEEESREPPVLVYYPNYSLPDLSFLQDIFKQDNSRQPIYLSPVKHEPPKMATESTGAGSEVKRRVPSSSGGNSASQRKCRPKSYTDYEMLLSQEFNEIKDWDSLNLLLPDDFKEFMEKNNLLRTPSNSSTTYTSEQQYGPSRTYPIMTTIPNNRAPHSVKLRSHTRQQQPSTKRYSLQEAHYDQNHYPHQRYHYPNEIDPEIANMNMNMTRSQTMPNCRPGFQHVPIGNNMGPHCPPPTANYYHNHNCCHPCCHSSCHSPSFHSSQTSPSKPPTFNWEMLSSSRFQKLLSFLSKLDECSSDHSDSSKTDTQKSAKAVAAANGINDQRNANHAPARGGRTDRRLVEPKTVPQEPTIITRERPTSMRAPSRSEQKSKASISVANKAATKVNSKATSPMSTNRDLVNRRPANAFEKTKIILKRPTALKSGISNSGIPVPKRTSSKSMIPTLPGKNSTQLKDTRTKDRLKSGAPMRF